MNADSPGNFIWIIIRGAENLLGALPLSYIPGAYASEMAGVEPATTRLEVVWKDDSP